jgi:hypothetical protein
MSDKHQQLGEFGAIPGAPNGPPPAPLTKLEIHPVANLFPPMREKEYEAFKAQIIKDQRIYDPIWTYQGKIIDGRHRQRVSEETGIPATYQEWDGKGSLTEFVLSQNLHRRHLKEAQRAMVAARIKPQFEEEARERQGWAGKDTDLSNNCYKGRASEMAGQMLGVSFMSVERACKILDNGATELIAAVDACQIAVSTAADLIEFPKEEQTRLLAAGRAEISKALQPIRDTRKKKSAAPPAEQAADAANTAFVPLDRPLEKKIFNHFNNGWILMKRTETGYRMEICEKYFSEELYRAIESPYFEQLTERGLTLVKVPKGA